MEIRYTDSAQEDFKKLDRFTQKRIAKKMRFYAEQKNPIVFAKRLTDSNEGEFRFSIGDYRLSFDVVGAKIFILHIERRDKAY